LITAPKPKVLNPVYSGPHEPGIERAHYRRAVLDQPRGITAEFRAEQMRITVMLCKSMLAELILIAKA
jgi:hypothetical protein